MMETNKLLMAGTGSVGQGTFPSWVGSTGRLSNPLLQVVYIHPSYYSGITCGPSLSSFSQNTKAGKTHQKLKKLSKTTENWWKSDKMLRFQL